MYGGGGAGRERESVSVRKGVTWANIEGRN